MSRQGPISVYLNRRMAALVGLGFASGLPYVLAGDTLSAWLSALHVDVKSIGLFSLVGLPYALKFLWAPLIDRYIPPGFHRLGRRRSWLAAIQLMLVCSLIALAAAGPRSAETSLLALAIVGVALVILSASQDIVADAYRTDVVHASERGAGAAVFVSGYRIATIVGGAFTLIAAEYIGWNMAYALMAILMSGTLIVTLIAPSPSESHAGPQSLREAIVRPVEQFLQARGWVAVVIVAFVIVFRLPDFLAARMTMPLLLQELGFTAKEVGWIRQFLGFLFTIAGALAGGAIVARLGIMRCLIVFGVLQIVSNAGFYALAKLPPNLPLMSVVIALENFCGGMVAAGFVAFLMACCDQRYSATQYALLSSGMAIAQALGGAVTGFAVERMGYANFFLLTIFAGAPGMMMLPLLRGAIGDDRQLEDTMTDADGAIPSNEAARKIASAGAD